MSRRLTLVAARQTPLRIARSAALVMVATLGSTILGFLREFINAAYFGTSGPMDAFLAAAVVPTILFGIFNGALVSALVPIFSDYVATDREEDAWRVASTLLIVIAIGLTAAAIIGAALAPAYVPWIARFDGDRLTETIAITRWLMPTIVATSLAGIISALLNAYSRFRATSIQGLVANAVTIIVVVVAFNRYGINALVFGSIAGVTAQVLVQLPALFSLGPLRFVVDLRHPGMIRLYRVLGPIAIGSAAGQAALFFDRFFASTLNVGSIAGMNYAAKLVGFPQQIFVAAIATVIFPVFASQIASKNKAAIRHSMATGIKMVIFLSVPSVVGLGVLAGPIVQTLFQHGAFDAEATVSCAALLPYAAAGLLATSASIILTRGLFAGGMVRPTVFVSVISVLANAGLSVILMPLLQARGLFLANAITQSAQAIVLGVFVYRMLGGLDLRSIAITFGKIMVCASVMAIAVVLVQIYRGPPPPTFLARATNLFEHMLFGGAIFLGCARIIDSNELKTMIDLLIRGRPRPDLVKP